MNRTEFPFFVVRKNVMEKKSAAVFRNFCFPFLQQYERFTLFSKHTTYFFIGNLFECSENLKIPSHANHDMSA